MAAVGFTFATIISHKNRFELYRAYLCAKSLGIASWCITMFTHIKIITLHFRFGLETCPENVEQPVFDWSPFISIHFIVYKIFTCIPCKSIFVLKIRNVQLLTFKVNFHDASLDTIYNILMQPIHSMLNIKVHHHSNHDMIQK